MELYHLNEELEESINEKYKLYSPVEFPLVLEDTSLDVVRAYQTFVQIGGGMYMEYTLKFVQACNLTL